MMLVGAGIIGICYALLNDFILGSRLRQVWDVARAPQRGHFIICGLGGIGINIASQLQSSGYEVVVIERDSECRFLSSARKQRIPVLIADASLSDTLSAAHIQQAEALIAVTSTDHSFTRRGCALPNDPGSAVGSSVALGLQLNPSSASRTGSPICQSNGGFGRSLTVLNPRDLHRLGGA
ncbi:MAG: NAD-binding protein [Thermostichus sp. DG02_5_bins_236]